MFTETADELNRRYMQTFIGLREKEAIVPVYVGQFSKVKNDVCVLDGAKYIPNGDVVAHELFSRPIRYDDIVWDAPLLGYIMCRDKTTKFVSRIPEAQPARTRGLLPALTHYLYWQQEPGGFIYQTLRKLFEQPNEIWDIPAVYNPTYLQIDEAWAAIRGNERIGAAISRNIAIIKTKLSRKPVVFYKDLVAGLYDKSGRIFLLPKAHLLYEEMSLYAPCEKVAAKEIPQDNIGTSAYYVATDLKAMLNNPIQWVANGAVFPNIEQQPNGEQHDEDEPNW